MMPPDCHSCATCADSADRVVVVALLGHDAEVRHENGSTATVAIDLLPDIEIGDALLVHQGVGISKLPTEDPS